MHALSISHFTKRYGSVMAVDDLSLKINPGEFFGFLGPNGAGKTTTINCITGIGKLTQGVIKVFGLDVVTEYREARKKIGLSPQEYNVDYFMTPRKILRYVGGYFGLERRAREKRIAELLKQFNLEPHADKMFRILSGGLKRRVMVARAMIHNPDLLILDEPTAGLDVELRRELWEYLLKINREGKTILFTSHYLEEVERLCSRIAVIQKGKIVTIEDTAVFQKAGKSLEEIYLQHANGYAP